jgi:hypothetical protein
MHQAAKPVAKRNVAPSQSLAKETPSPAGSPQADGSNSTDSTAAGEPPATAPGGSTMDVAAALARQTQQYARNMQDSVSKYAANHSTQGAQGGQETMAGWVDPTDFRIGPADGGKPGVAPTTNPSQAYAAKSADLQRPLANQPIAVGDTKKAADAANTPATISENPSDQSANNTNGANTANTLASNVSGNNGNATGIAHGAGDALASKITQRAKDFPRDLSAQLDYQLLLFLQDQSVPELTSLAPLPTEDRELLSAVLDGVSNFRNTLRQDNNMLLSQKIRPLTDLADRLRSQADLSIPTLELCRQVDGFGRYETMDTHLLAGQDNPAIIYCELANFSSQQKADTKQWQTDVTEQAVLYVDTTGEQVWSNKVQQITDQSRNRRHDFFVRTLETFPKNLGIGRYLLKVTIVDKQTNRMAEATLPIEIVAKQGS